MNNRFLLAVILGVCLTPLGATQEWNYPYTEETHWGNPYPGWENVSPGSVDFLQTLPSTVTLYANDVNPPTLPTSELYRTQNPQRTGFFQKIDFDALWAPSSGSRGLGITELDLSATFALPLPTRDSPLLLTPKLETTFFDSKGWNETFYTTGLDMRWIHPIVKNKLTASLGFGVFYSGDFKVRAGDALRFPAHIAGVWHLNPRTKIVLGAIYSDRRDSYNWLPTAGLIWTPHDDLNVELVFPRMKIAQRLRWLDTKDVNVYGSLGTPMILNQMFGMLTVLGHALFMPGKENWLYTSLEFGGGSWGREPIKGVNTDLDYRDIRLALGYERRTHLGPTLGLEVGYMFDRHMQINGFGGKDSLSNAVFLRLRSSF